LRFGYYATSAERFVAEASASPDGSAVLIDSVLEGARKSTSIAITTGAM